MWGSASIVDSLHNLPLSIQEHFSPPHDRWNYPLNWKDRQKDWTKIAGKPWRSTEGFARSGQRLLPNKIATHFSACHLPRIWNWSRLLAIPDFIKCQFISWVLRPSRVTENPAPDRCGRQIRDLASKSRRSHEELPITMWHHFRYYCKIPSGCWPGGSKGSYSRKKVDRLLVSHFHK